MLLMALQSPFKVVLPQQIIHRLKGGNKNGKKDMAEGPGASQTCPWPPACCTAPREGRTPRSRQLPPSTAGQDCASCSRLALNIGLDNREGSSQLLPPAPRGLGRAGCTGHKAKGAQPSRETAREPSSACKSPLGGGQDGQCASPKPNARLLGSAGGRCCRREGHRSLRAGRC